LDNSFRKLSNFSNGRNQKNGQVVLLNHNHLIKSCLAQANLVGIGLRYCGIGSLASAPQATLT
jgi:hypothetical protein